MSWNERGNNTAITTNYTEHSDTSNGHGQK